MQISVYNNNQQLGPFDLDAIHNMVRLGSLPQTAHVWYEGAPDWIPLPTFLQQYPLPAAPAAPAMAPARAVAVPGRVSPEMLAAARAHTAAQGAQGQTMSDAQRLVRATIAGGVAALIGGGVWAGLIISIKVELGYVAWGIGLLCGFAVSKLGRGNGTIFQVMAVVCSLLGIGIGKLAYIMSADGAGLSIVDTLGPVDILFVVLAIASAWRVAGGGED